MFQTFEESRGGKGKREGMFGFEAAISNNRSYPLVIASNVLVLLRS